MRRNISLFLTFILIFLFVGCKEKNDVLGVTSNVVASAESDKNISSDECSSDISKDITSSKSSTVSSSSKVTNGGSDTVSSIEKTESSQQEEIIIPTFTDEVVKVYNYNDAFVIPTAKAFSYSDSFTGMTMPYRLFLPKNYSSSEKYPVLLFLHGLGEVGTDNQSQLYNFQQAFNVAGDILCQAIIICPQSPRGWGAADDEYSDLSTAKRLLEDIIEKYNGDRNRIYVTGLSLGGNATWNMLEKYGNYFAAGVPICGWGNANAAYKLANIPIWVFHGTDDTTVHISGSENMVRAITNAGGGMIEFTRLQGVKHNAWNYAYTNREMFCWMFSQSLESHQSFLYDYLEYFKVTDPNGNVLFTEEDITFVLHSILCDQQFIEVKLTNSAFQSLQKAYRDNIGKTFTVYYCSEKLYSFKYLSEPDDGLFYIRQVISDEDFEKMVKNFDRINAEI